MSCKVDDFFTICSCCYVDYVPDEMEPWEKVIMTPTSDYAPTEFLRQLVESIAIL